MADHVSTARARFLRGSPQKFRLVIDQIRGKDVNEAYAILQFSKKKASLSIDKVLKSAVANATYKADEAGETLDVDDWARLAEAVGVLAE